MDLRIKGKTALITGGARGTVLTVDDGRSSRSK
jgi:hypothetical protein